MGIGGMVGGGIFSVLGLSIAQAGHAAPVAFLLGGVIASLTGMSYARLGLTFHQAGGSFTYLERAFVHRNIAGIGGWLLLVGYVGTLSLYAYTFGVYGAAMLGHSALAQHALESFVLLVLLGLNLYGVQASGSAEDLIVLVKVLILLLFAGIGLFYLQPAHFQPLLSQGMLGLVMGASLVFVAYEGFELIPNAVKDMAFPQHDLARSIIISIAVTAFIYVLVSLVAVGTLKPDVIARAKEYALAAAAEPFLGKLGYTLIAVGAMLSTASAINATMFGSARLGLAMAREHSLPAAFSFRERHGNIPWVSLIVITAAALLLTNTTDLTVISAFASSTFLLIFAAINYSAWRLRRTIGLHPAIPLAGLALTGLSWLVLCGYLWTADRHTFVWIAAAYLIVIAAELLFSERRLPLPPRK